MWKIEFCVNLLAHSTHLTRIFYAINKNFRDFFLSSQIETKIVSNQKSCYQTEDLKRACKRYSSEQQENWKQRKYPLMVFANKLS